MKADMHQCYGPQSRDDMEQAMCRPLAECEELRKIVKRYPRLRPEIVPREGFDASGNKIGMTYERKYYEPYLNELRDKAKTLDGKALEECEIMITHIEDRMVD